MSKTRIDNITAPRRPPRTQAPRDNIVICPKCRYETDLIGETLTCPNCGRVYLEKDYVKKPIPEVTPEQKEALRKKRYPENKVS